ncbi:MAG: PAAR domain-containing protein [Luteibacter sp.]
MFSHFIVDGDTTDHGGRVSVPTSRMDIFGRNVATVGDAVHCPKCNVVATIIEGTSWFDLDGIPVAAIGHLTSCGARLVSIMRKTVGFDEHTGPVAGSVAVDADEPPAARNDICEACLDEAAMRGTGLLDRG